MYGICWPFVILLLMSIKTNLLVKNVKVQSPKTCILSRYNLDFKKNKTYEYIPFPGPPAEKLPPPPISICNTQNGTKFSVSVVEAPLKATTKCAKLGNGVGPSATLLRSFSICNCKS